MAITSVFTFFVISLFPVFLSLFVLWSNMKEKTAQTQLLFMFGISTLGFISCIKLIPVVSQLCLRAKLSGFDINKGGSEPIPESLGLVSATNYLVCVIMFQPMFYAMLGEYNAAVLSICFMALLGFADDVLDLRWSIKIALSFLATLPLLVAYTGPTNIVVPKPLVPFLGYPSVQLGLLYHIYMSFISVFCTNSINILAGINGLEVGQSIIIGISVFIHSAIQLVYLPETPPQASLLSLFLIVPFIFTSTALFYYNRYPSRVFVGDTYTYFAGMTLAVTGILGHFSKTLMLFFIPQFINFVISLPQLFGIIPCPRHRLPRLNKTTMKLEGIPTNLNLVNMFLILFGPMTESQLCVVILGFQVLCNAIGFLIRYKVSTYFF